MVAMIFVAFLSAEPRRKPRLPIMSSPENLDVLAIKDRAAFILCHRKKNNGLNFPTTFSRKSWVYRRLPETGRR